MGEIYYKIESNIHDPYTITNGPVLFESGALSMKFGCRLTISASEVFVFDINYPAESQPGHFLEGVGTVAVSKLFLMALKRAGVDNFEVFPAILRNSSAQKEWHDYYAFNEIGVLDAALLNACTYETITSGNELVPPLLAFTEVVLSAGRVKGVKMFRLLQDHSLYFSGNVMTTLRSLAPPEKWGITSTITKVC